MSTVYNLEPQPTAKVLLHTTAGDISLELFAQQTPLTSRNFLQHCLDSYYDNTIFHRLVSGFIVQGGDPTGTGHGGESSFEGGAPFADEFHSRLKFNRRGLLGMANTGEKNDNGSQFFFTLGKTEELNGRNTMFGRVVGDTIYNLVKMGEAELTEEEGSERPMYPTRITGTEVLVNPFDDMVPRIKERVRKVEEKQPKKTTKKKKAGKALLSFGNEEGDEDVAPLAAAKFNPTLINAETTSSAAPKRPAPDNSLSKRPSKRRASSSPPSSDDEESTVPARVPQKVAKAHSTNKQSQPASKNDKTRPSNTNRESESGSESGSDPDSDLEINRKNTELLTAANAQIEALKSSLKRDVPQATAHSQHKKTALEAMIPEGSIRGRKRPKPSSASTSISRDEQRTLDSFNAFKKRLEDAAASAPASRQKVSKQEDARRSPKTGKSPVDNLEVNMDEEELAPSHAVKSNGRAEGTANDDEEAALCDLHFIANCQSCSRWDFAEADGDKDTADSDDNDVGWMGKQLTFAKDRLGKDLEWKRQNEQDLVVIDPKEKAREIKEEKKTGEAREGGEKSLGHDLTIYSMEVFAYNLLDYVT